MHVELAQIIEATGAAAIILPLMLMIAAVMSQFSAAVADTGGAGGLLNENSNKRLSTRISYVGVTISAILLVWAVDLMEIITLASRAFATYYFLQTLLALFFCYKDCPLHSRLTIFNRVFYMVVAVILLYVIFFAIPVE
jgi:amino acid transporter